MDRFERGVKSKTEDAQEVVKGVDDDVSPADLRREAAVAAQNQAAAEQAASEPSFVVDNPLPGGGDHPGVVTEVQSLAPEHGTSPPLLVPSEGDDQEEEDDSGSDPDAENYHEDVVGFRSIGSTFPVASPNQAARLDVMEDVVSADPSRLTEPNDGGIAERKADGEQQEYGLDQQPARLVGDEIALLKSDDSDPGASIPPVQGWIDYPDFLDTQLKADDISDPGQFDTAEYAAESLHGYGTGSGLPRDDAGVTQLGGDEPFGFTAPDDSGGAGVHDGNVVSESTTAGDLDRGPDMGFYSERIAQEGYVGIQVPRDDAGGMRLGDDEPIPGFTAPDDSGGGADRMIDGDPDRPILMETPTGNLTTDGELDRGPITLNAKLGNFETQDFSGRDDSEELTVEGLSSTGESTLDPSGERPLGLVLEEYLADEKYLQSADEAMESGDDLRSERVLEGAEPLEFIIGDGGPMRPPLSMSGEDDSGFDTPENLSTDIFEQELEFKSTSGMDDKQKANEMIDTSDPDMETPFESLGGPDTATRIFGLPEVPNVADAFPEPDPLGMTKADVISEISVDPLSYDQSETLTSSLDDDDDDPLDGL
jgi:hypothetical protein